MESIEILSSNISILENNALGSCPNLKSIKVAHDNPFLSTANNVLYNKDKTKIILVPQKIKGKYVIPSTVSEIGEYAFYNCSKITDIIIPSSVTNIGKYAFAGTGITKIDLPENITKIDTGLFLGSELKKVTIPSKVKSIGHLAFSQCDNLEQIIVLSDLERIEDDAFEYNSERETPPDLIFNNSGNILPEMSERTPYILSIKSNKILYNYVILSDSTVRLISCSDMIKYNHSDTITVPSKVEIKDKQYKVTHFECAGTLIKKVILPETITTLNHSFYWRSNLRSVEIPYGVTAIDDYAFYKCENLKNITIPSSVTSIGNNAFGECVNLEDIVIPSNVTTIEESSFSGCYNLNVVVHNSKKNINEDIFKDCKSVKYTN